jgi:prepilin-type N-terminal cleavage/methylation domain-containing protein
MMKRNGFSIIEVVIGMLIASILSVIIYRMFTQTMRIARMSEGFIEEYGDAFIMANQIERDIMTIVVLKEHAKLAEKQEAEPKPLETPAGQQPLEKTSIDLTETPKNQEGEKQDEEERLAFAGVIKDNKLSSLSFVCTNALPQAEGGGSRLVRVRYVLAPDPDDATLSQLMREERRYQAKVVPGVQSDKPQAYIIMPRVESITVKFYGTLHAQKTDDKTSSGAGEPIALSSWGNEEQRRKLKRLVPEYLEIVGTCRSRGTNGTLSFSYFIAIPAGIAEGVDAREKERREGEKK